MIPTTVNRFRGVFRSATIGCATSSPPDAAL
jgi:hypothetical protein